MKLLPLAFAMLLWLSMPAQSPANTSPDPFQALKFLEGTWETTVQNNAAVSGSGRYTFGRELNGHIFARHFAKRHRTVARQRKTSIVRTATSFMSSRKVPTRR